MLKSTAKGIVKMSRYTQIWARASFLISTVLVLYFVIDYAYLSSVSFDIAKAKYTDVTNKKHTTRFLIVI